MLGKLKRSLKERCPDCGKILQIRVRDIRTIENGEIATIAEEYICCSNKNCDYEREAEKKRRRKQEDLIL